MQSVQEGILFYALNKIFSLYIVIKMGAPDKAFNQTEQ